MPASRFSDDQVLCSPTMVITPPNAVPTPACIIGYAESHGTVPELLCNACRYDIVLQVGVFGTGRGYAMINTKKPTATLITTATTVKASRNARGMLPPRKKRATAAFWSECLQQTGKYEQQQLFHKIDTRHLNINNSKTSRFAATSSRTCSRWSCR